MAQPLALIASFGASLWFEALLLRPLGRRPSHLRADALAPARRMDSDTGLRG
jgi:hypothetical protein